MRTFAPLSVIAGGPPLAAAGRAAADDYTVNRYHKPQDEYGARWKWDGALSDLNIYCGLGHMFADGTIWPGWYAGSECRVVHEQSRAGAK